MSRTSTLDRPVRPPASNLVSRLVNLLPAAPSGWVRPIVIANLVGEIGIVVTGGVVRLTGSGLGCTTWPECMPGSFTPVRTDASQFHDLVEFGNRTLTGVVGILAIATIWAVFTRWPARTRMHVLALAVLGGIVVQGVLGGITVLTGLNPWLVMGHFLVSMVLVAVSTALLRGTLDERHGPGELVVHPLARSLAIATSAVGAVVLVLGTVVTGSGPHSGDALTPNRTGFDPKTVSWLHADLVMLFCGLVIATLATVIITATSQRVKRSWYVVLAVTLAQGVIGYAQYFTGLPVLLVLLHMLGATLLVVALTRGVLDTRSVAV
ncbi:MAG: COX15/CtaA family protein [Humibacillus sp.]|nr:COX15/CtaA family protein [Humibacillus sp.]MDN5775978.1 COX15/CtaA family protein [Humibacillus sp.]